MQTDNIAFTVLERAFSQPDRPAFIREGVITHQRFADLAVHFARRMQALGVGNGSIVGLSITSPMVAAVAVTAIGLLGASWVSYSEEKAQLMPVRVTHVFAGLSRQRAGGHTLDQDWFDAPATAPEVLAEFPGQSSPGDTWMYAHSSGTTGTPKYMAFSYRLVWLRSVPVAQPPSVLVNLFPATSFVSIRFNLECLAHGGAVVEMTRSMDELVAKGVTLVLGSPSHLAAHLARLAPPATRLPAFRSTGAPITGRFVERALRYFDEVQLLYGATEAGTVTLARFDANRPYAGSVGKAIEGVRVEVVDGEGRICPPDVEGILRIKSDNAVTGYLGRPDLDATIFRDGWFHPGDVARIDRDGNIHISGRTDDVINVNGSKINAVTVDEGIELHPDIVDGYSFVDRDPEGTALLAAIVEVRAGASPENLRSLKPMIEKLGRSAWPRRIYVAPSVPRNENGKPMRASAATLAPTLPFVDLP